MSTVTLERTRQVLAEAAALHAHLAGAELGPVTRAADAMIAAFAHGGTWGVIGALAFYASDTLLGLDRFVAPLAAAPVAVMVTYHLALAGLLLSLP